MVITRIIVEDAINELNEILRNDLQTKEFHLSHDNKKYYLVDEINQIYDSGSLKSIHKTVSTLFAFYCEITS